MANKRIFVTVTPEQLTVVQDLMKQEKRSQAAIASIIFEDGLKLVNTEKDLVSFGNFLLKKHGVGDGVGDWDLDQWRNKG